MNKLSVEFRLWLITVLFGWALTLAPKHHPEGMITLRALYQWSGECLIYRGASR